MAKHTINESINVNSSGAHSVTVTLSTAGKFVDRDIDVVATANVPKAEITTTSNGMKVSTGYVDSEINTSVSGGTLNNTATAGVTNTKETGANTIIPAGGSLYINEGYYPNTEITLGQMIPDDADYTNAGNGHILYGYEAYDTNGNKLIGTIPTLEPQFASAETTVDLSGGVDVSPNVEIKSSGTMKTVSGYGVTTTKPSGVDGTNYLSIDGTGTPTDGVYKFSADINIGNIYYENSVTGYVDKAGGTVAYSVPKPENTEGIERITPSVTDNFSPLYMPITSVSHSGGTITTTVNGFVNSSPSATSSISGTVTSAAGVTTSKPSGTDGTDYLTIEPSISKDDGLASITSDAHVTAVTYTNNAGAIAAHNGATAKEAGYADDTGTIDVSVETSTGSTYYMSRSTIGSSASVTKAPSVAVSGTANGFTASSTATTHYVTVNGSATNGTASSTYSASAGFTPVISSGAGSGATITPSVTGDNGKVYIPDGGYSASVNSHSITKAPTATAGTSVSTASTGYSVSTLSAAPTGKPYLTIAPTITSETGTSSAKATATISTAGYIVTGNKTTSSADTKSISVTTSTSADKYIEIYDGTYSKS